MLVDKNVKRLFWLQLKSCTERGTYLYKSVQQFQSVPLKEIIQKLLCDPQTKCSIFEFTVLREMYGQRNSSGAYVHFNQHGCKTNLYKCNGLKYALEFWRNCCFKVFVSLNIKKLVSRSQQNACRFSCKVSAGVIRF